MTTTTKGYFTKAIMVTVLTLALAACGSKNKNKDFNELVSQTTALGVNGYLWQATLDTLSFMPMEQLNPAAGAIISEWYIDPNASNERLKVMVQFYGEQLRADGVQVTVNRQEKTNGDWVSVAVKAATGLELEEAILTRARQLRIGQDN